MTDIKSVKKAMKKGNVLAVTNALKENLAELLKPTKVAGTLLHSACRIECKLEICRLLIDNGFDVNSTESGWNLPRRTPLNLAAYNGHYNICELLIQKGAKVHDDTMKAQPLVSAILGGHARICTLLIDNGAPVMGLESAASEGHLEVYKVLIERGHSVSGALECAAESGNLSCLQIST